MSLLRLFPRLLLPAVLAACSVAAVRAQDLTTGAIGGVVLDAQGRALRGARVHLVAGASAQRDVLTDEAGEFLFGQVTPGAVSLHVASDGFTPADVRELTVALGRTERMVVHLQVAGASQAILVRAEDAAQPSLADSPLNATLSPQELLALPIDGRRFQSFALLTPLVNLADTPSDTDAVTGSVDDVSADTVRLTVRGLDPSQNSYAQDGLTNQRSYDGEPRGGNLVPFTLPQEAVREFQVRVTGAGTPLGRDAGGSVNAVTRRGEEALHGSLFFLLRNSGVGASDPFAIATRYNNDTPTSEFVKPRDQREQFGGSLGHVLPRTHRKVYAFAAAEAQRRSFPAVSSPDNANFFRLTPTQTALLANRGVSTSATARALSFLDSLAGPVARQANELAVLPRLDVQPGSRSSIDVTYTGVRYNAPAGLREGAVIPRSRDNFGTLVTHTDTIAAGWNVTLSERWLNTLRLQATRDAVAVEAAPPLPQEPLTAPGGAVPQVTIDLGNSGTSGAFVFGTPASLQRRRLPEEKRAEANESVTFSGRAHTVSLGVSGSIVDTAIDTGIATNGSYQYSSGAVNGRAGGLVDFITDYTFSALAYPNGGCPSIFATVHLFCFQGYTQSYGAGTSVRFHTGEAAAFVTDAWRLTPRLRVDVGARYEYFRMPLPQHANAVLDAVFGSFAATNDYPGDPGNLAPHLGIAYGLRNRTVVRLGYGIHFGRVTGRVLQQVLQNTAQPANTYQIHLTPRTEVDARCASAGTNFGYPATYTCVPAGTVAQTSSATLLARRFQLPMVQDAEFTVEHSFRRGLTVSASYALSLARELPNSIDLNIAPSTSRAAFRIQRSDGLGEAGAQNGSTFNVPLYTLRISPLFGPVTAVLSNGNAVSHAAVVQLTRVASHGITLRAAYTFSNSTDLLRTSGAGADQNAQFDPRDPTYDNAASNFDRPHKVVASAVWSPELHSDKPLLRVAANGWSIAPLFFATSGRPYSYLIEGGTSLPGGRDSINGSGGATYLPTVGRNTLRLPWSQNLDLRVLRSIDLRQRVQVRLSAEAFNLANHRNINAVQQRAFLAGTAVNGVTPLVYQDSATIAAEGLVAKPFGTATSAANSLTRERRLQFGVRMQW